MSEPAASQHLTRTIGRWQIMFYGLGSMLGTGIYALIGKTAGVLGNAMWLAFIMAMIAALLTGLSYASLGSRHPKAGGAAYITERATKRAIIGYVAGIVVMMSGLTSMATGLLAIAASLVGAGVQLPVKLLAILIAAFIGLVIYRGIRESMWLNLFCTLIEVGGLVFIIAVGMRFWGNADYLQAPPSAAGAGIAGIAFTVILQGAVLTFFSFIGFEDILNVSEETVNPQRSIPFGLVGAMTIATVIYIAVSITAVSVVPWQSLAESKTPLMDVAHHAAPWFAGIDKVFFFISIFAIGNTALLNYIMGSRLLYGMSNQGLLPRMLGKVHPRRHTPHVSIAALFAVVVALILVGEMKQLAEATSVLLLSVFVVMNVSLIILKMRRSEAGGAFEVPMFVPIAGAAVCSTLIIARIHGAWTSVPADKNPWVSLIIAGSIVACGMVMFFVTNRRGFRPENLPEL
ncbi:MAG: amino acid permease [Verrucomicrobiota bacterium]